MPNWCSDSIMFYQEDRKNDRLLKLKDAIDNCGYAANEGDKDWIGHLLVYLGLPKDINCRAFFAGYGEIGEDSFDVYYNSAWYSKTEAYNLIAKHFDLNYELYAEECGCGVYINTDTEGRFFTDRYRIYVSNEDEDHEEYFATFDDLKEYCNKINIKGETLEELVKSAEEKDCYINEFSSQV